MTDVIKVLGQLDVSATTTTVLYTVPNLTQTTVSSLVICNRSGSGITFRVSIHVAGAGADDKQFTANASLKTFLTDEVSLVFNVTHQDLTSENFAEIQDLLGATSYLNRDSFDGYAFNLEDPGYENIFKRYFSN